jgi:hypothetical protein
MPLWNVQWYGNVPLVWNVKLNVPPAGSVPESNAPMSLVTVCAMESVFVHVTAVPAATVIGFGANALLPLFSAPDGVVTALPEPEPPVAGGVGLGDDTVELPLPHAAASVRLMIASAIRNFMEPPCGEAGLTRGSSNAAARAERRKRATLPSRLVVEVITPCDWLFRLWKSARNEKEGPACAGPGSRN